MHSATYGAQRLQLKPRTNDWLPFTIFFNSMIRFICKNSSKTHAIKLFVVTVQLSRAVQILQKGIFPL